MFWATSFTLVAFLGLAGMALDRSYINSNRVAVRNQLGSHINVLLAALEVTEDGKPVVSDRLIEPRLSAPGTELYALILGAGGKVLWQSASALGFSLDHHDPLPPGKEIFGQLGTGIDSPFAYSYGISWELDTDRSVEVTLVVIDASNDFLKTVRSYRQELAFWLGGAGFLLLVMQILCLQWGLRPLRKVMRELDRIEHAAQARIEGAYPEEIAQLSSRINLLIENDRKNLSRYRHTLGDLAHSLKTPLAIIRGMLEEHDAIDHDELGSLLDQMNHIVEYQLRRAASSTNTATRVALEVGRILKKLDQSLRKVYVDKSLTIRWEIAANARFYGNEGDLYELLGNVMDNAYKWSCSKLMYRVLTIPHGNSARGGLVIEIHDDGPGVSAEDQTQVLQRGARLDQGKHGYGIGLSVVCEILQRYRGEIDITDSELGGARVRIVLLGP